MCALLLFPHNNMLRWLVVSLEGIANTTGVHVYRSRICSNILIHSICIHMIIHSICIHMIMYKHNLIINTYIICNYNFVNMLLTRALMSSNIHDI
jgi:hypothetical protein